MGHMVTTVYLIIISSSVDGTHGDYSIPHQHKLVCRWDTKVHQALCLLCFFPPQIYKPLDNNKGGIRRRWADPLYWVNGPLVLELSTFLRL